MESTKIVSLKLENVKRVKAVSITPTKSGLTVIGGKNGQGKTSVLDAIAWCLGGDKYRPDAPNREGSVLPPDLEIRLSNGLLVQRKGKNSDLKVTDTTGKRYGQALLNEFVNTFAIDLPKFLNATDKEKADTLLQIIGVKEKLQQLEQAETEVYNHRRAIGQIADQKDKFAKEQPFFPDVPDSPISASELILQQQEILSKNAKNMELRRNKSIIEAKLASISRKVEQYQEALTAAKTELEAIESDYKTACESVVDLKDESTEELEESIRSIEEINRKIRANLDKSKAEDDAKVIRHQYDELTNTLSDVRTQKSDLLKSANLPYEGLTVENGKLLLNGHSWDCMSGADQLIVGTAIARAIHPKCGFVLLDKLEQMDEDTLNAFGEWLQAEGLQAIATRVSTGEECTIIIEDGEIKPKEWKEGMF